MAIKTKSIKINIGNRRDRIVLTINVLVRLDGADLKIAIRVWVKPVIEIYSSKWYAANAGIERTKIVPVKRN
jgi:hypothetical protein